MICAITLQTEIFHSPGYLKFVTQTGGSMDLLLKLAPLKAKSLAYQFNNLKIRKIISIQRKKEAIMKTVDRLKEKMKRWRAFTRTTLEPSEGKSAPLRELREPLLKQGPSPSDREPSQRLEKDGLETDAAAQTPYHVSELSLSPDGQLEDNDGQKLLPY